MSVAWYTYADGVRLGPMTWDEVREAAKSGSLKPDHWVWTAGYGAEWRRAAALETLFPPADKAKAPPPAPAAAPPPGPGERGADPGPGPRRTAAGFADALRFRLRAERSPFEPSADAPADGPRRPVRPLASLGTAWANMRVLLFAPFSFRRWLLVSVASFLVLLGSQPEFFAAPDAVGFSAGSARPAAAARTEPAAPVSKLAGFARRWQDGSVAAEAADDPDAVRAEFAEALRADCVAVRDWAARTFARPRTVAFFALLLLAYAALRAWFLSRAWSLLLDNVYRRDDPAFLAWADAARPARDLFRPLLLLRIAFVALYAVAVVRIVSHFAALPAGQPVPPRAVPLAAGTLSLLLLADAAATAFVRDCLAPRALLLRTGFRGAVASLRRDAGWWILRYFAALAVYALVFAFAVNALSGLVRALVESLGVPTLARFVLAALVMPLQLWRTLWSLDLLFRLRPELRSALPPRRAEEILRKMQGGARGR